MGISQTTKIEVTAFRRILAATDFSSAGDAAVRQAFWAAQLYSAPLVVAHVFADVRKAISQRSIDRESNSLKDRRSTFNVS
jgi:hypothetical protein